MEALATRRWWLDATEIRTERLVLRALSPADGADIGRALWTNRDHLAPWIDVPSAEPTEASMRRRMHWFADGFAAGTRFYYTLRDPACGALHGCVGLIPSGTAWTISYWLVAAHTRRGYAREAVAALVRLAFMHPGVHRLSIRCLEGNHRSASVARALGFKHTGGRDGVQEWTLTRDRPSSPFSQSRQEHDNVTTLDA
jgi:RimJ/RimL family protein N-acetyltransferase